MISFIHKIVFTVTFLIGFSVHSQVLSNYKYVIVPEQFDFQKSPHDYDVNKMIQFTFNKYDFTAVLKGSVLPDGIDFCDALYASVSKKGLIKTVMILTLQDCHGKTIFTSQEGTSLKKDYKVAYFQSIREIFKDPNLKSHKYIPNKGPKTQEVSKLVKAETMNQKTNESPNKLEGKGVVKTPAKITGPSLVFKLREKQYVFQPIGKNYVIKQAGKTIGEARLNPDNASYTLKAGVLSGKGVFDDYGNFELNRINPLTKKPIEDILARIN